MSDRADTPSCLNETNWKHVEIAPYDREVLEALLRRYEPVIRNYLMMSKHLPADEASSLALDFIADKFVAGNLLERASQRHQHVPGMRFRDYLFQAINNWTRDQFRRESRHAGSKPLEVVAEPQGREDNPDDAFLRSWLGELLNEALGRLFQECQKPEAMVRWNVFRACTLLDPPWKYEQCRDIFGLKSTGQVAGLLSRARERFLRLVEGRLQMEERKEVDPREELLPLVRRCRGLRLNDFGFLGAVGEIHDSIQMMPLDDRAGERLTELLCPRTTEGYLQEMLDTPLPIWSMTRPGEEEGPRTLAELLTHPAPPRELLVRMKDYIKTFNAPENSSEQRNAACWVYAAILACALVTLNQKISTLNSTKLRRCFAENLAMPWSEAVLSPLLTQALEKLDAAR